MASITDVARHAHVGVGTVSRVISGKGYVSEATREKVMQSVRALNYVPNELARNLLQNRTNTIAVIVPDFKNRFYTSFVDEVEFALRKKNYKTLLCNSFGKSSNEQEFLNMLDRNLVDGIITMSNLLSTTAYARVTKPMVSFDSALSPSIPMVYADHQTGGMEAARILIEAGCRKVLQFRDDIDLKLKNVSGDIVLTLDDFPYVRRHSAFEEYIRKAGAEYHETAYVDAHTIKEQKQLVEEIYDAFPDADGVMATDIVALEYAQIALSRGRRIPEDLKIIAYDGTDLLDLFPAPVSCIRQPVKDIAEACTSVLLTQIEGEQPESFRIKIPVQVQNIYTPGGKNF